MGKGPKHNNNKSRSNGIFKVAGQNFKTDKKGKPKEVISKVKLVRELQFLSADCFSATFSRFPAKTKRKSAILMIR